MVYTAIFQDDGGQFTYDIYDAPHGFSRAWSSIQEDGQKNGNRRLSALVPGNHQVGFRHNLTVGPSPFSQSRRAVAWSIS